MRARRLAAVALVLLMLASCSAQLSAERESGTTLMTGLDDGGMDALMPGVLSVTDSGCVGLDDGSGVVPTVWPSGVSLTPDGQGIVVDGAHVPFGTQITGGGGEVSGLPQAPPAECEASRYIQLWSVVEIG